MAKTIDKNSYRSKFLTHRGYVTDKWDLYLDVYDRCLSWRKNEIKSMLEIGVQNGGSLAIWARYLPKAEVIIGADIEEKCSELRYQDQRIRVIIADATSDKGVKKIRTSSQNFDFILDDGSHTSEHIVSTFIKLLPALNPGGTYIIEDLHASYWPQWQGGLQRPDSSIEFLKKVIDVLHHDYWENSTSIRTFLGLSNNLETRRFLAALEDVLSIQFLDSLCIIEKRAKNDLSRLGSRVVEGSVADVFPAVSNLNGSKCINPLR